MATTKRKPTKHDPTRTQTIRAEWSREVNRRFNRFKRDSTVAFVEGPPFPVTNAAGFDYTTNPTAILEFLAWIDAQINETIFDNFEQADPNFWQNRYLNRGYTRGARIARMGLRKQAGPVAIGGILDELQIPTLATPLPALGVGVGGLAAFGEPIHLDAVRVLHTREYAALRGVTDAMRSQMARVLTGGIAEGLNTREIAKNMADRIDKIGITRARLIAQTETIRAYNIGSINEGERVGKEAGVEVKYLWQSAEDLRVRVKHAEWNQDLMTKKTAMARIGEPNCRCSVAPTVIEDLDSEERAGMRERKKRGLALATQ